MRSGLAVTLSLGLLVAVGCKKKDAGPPQRPAPMVRVTQAVTQDVPMYIDGIGTCTAASAVSITPRVTGQIIKRHFEDGETLTVKQPLFSIDPDPYQATLDAAQADLEQAKASEDFAKIELERYDAIAGTKAVSKSDYDTKKNSVKVAEARVASAAADVKTAKLNLSFCSITSPIAGRAGARLVDVGNVVEANKGDLLSIQAISPIYVDFTVTEQQLAAVRKNMGDGTLKTYISLPTDTGTGALGSLTFLDNSVQQSTGTVKLRATLPNKDEHFWPGQFVRVRLVLKTLKDAIMVPTSALNTSQQGQFVFVVDDKSTAQMRPVTQGQQQGDMMVITSGLKEGENVVVEGEGMVNPGAPVTVMKAPASAPAGTQPAAEMRPAAQGTAGAPMTGEPPAGQPAPATPPPGGTMSAKPGADTPALGKPGSDTPQDAGSAASGPTTAGSPK